MRAQLEPKEEWFRKAAEAEDNGIVSVGGMAVRIAALERRERHPELKALGKLLELRRREKGLTVEEVARRAEVTAAALEALERGLRLLDTRDVIGAVAKALDLPAEKLLAAAGLNGSPDPELSSAVLRFAAAAQPAGRLSPSEEAALKQILNALAVA